MDDRNSDSAVVYDPLSIRNVFNGTIVSAAICAAYELGLLDQLRTRGQLDAARFARVNKLDEQVVNAVVTALAYAEVVQAPGQPGTGRPVTPGPQFGEAWRNKGYFLWLMGGYGPLISRAAEQSRLLGSGVVKYERDSASIAAAAGDYGREYVDDIFARIVGALRFNRAADVGCGNAARLIELARARPDCSCIGIEIDPRAVEAARRNVDRAQLADRIEIVLGDAEQLADSGFPDVELVFSFFMGHDFWPMPRCRATLGRLRRAFPDVQRFLLADTYASAGGNLRSTPIFTLGFEFTHALMGKQVPTLAEWKVALSGSAWDLIAIHPLDIANSVVFDLQPGAAQGDR